MSNNTSKTSKATALAHVQALVAGTTKHFSGKSFTLGNVAYTEAELVGLFQGLAEAFTAVDAAHARAKDAVAALRVKQAQVGPILRAYKRMLLVTFGTATQMLTDFDLQAPKARKTMTGEQTAAATAKRRATRQARGTVGKKKKLAIKGDVTSILVTPVTHAGDSKAAAAPAQPASNASAPGGAPR